MTDREVAVIDVETTGLYPGGYDRVVEVAAVVMDARGVVRRTYCSLVNPGRDIGPTSIHGLTPADVRDAPRFDEIAGDLLAAVDGCAAVVGHNVDFDARFLDAECKRAGLRLPELPTLCTMRLAGGRALEACCDTWGVDGPTLAHSALDDALATSRLLARLLQHQPGIAEEISALPPIAWPSTARAGRPAVTRAEVRARQARRPEYLDRLLALVGRQPTPGTPDPGRMDYARLLDRALEDRLLDAGEVESLVAIARERGLSGAEVAAVHDEYMAQLIAAARADGVVTAAERTDIDKVARMLGIGVERVESLLAAPPPLVTQPRVDDLTGKRVCFTGELQRSLRGIRVTRELAVQLAAERGLLVASGVSRKVDLLVCAHGESQSTKARKARELGVRIVEESVWWQMLGIEVT